MQSVNKDSTYQMKNDTVRPKKCFSSVVETEIYAKPSVLFVPSVLFTAFDFTNIYEFVFEVSYFREHIGVD